jgi:hypothetical protein
MPKIAMHWCSLFLLSFCCTLAQGQSPQSLIQQVVNVELAANQNDHSNWAYLEEIKKPKEHLVQWVAATQAGNIERVTIKNDQRLSLVEEQAAIQKFLHDARSQKKQVSENEHDTKQIDDLLRLLPGAFRWTQTDANPTDTFLHFEPDPNFHPPTREAKVFSAMAGSLIVDNQQHRIRSMSGHLIQDVTFGGGLLGKLKKGSSFSLEQAQVGPSLWQLTAIHVHLDGNALLFKSVSLDQDDERSKFVAEDANLTLVQAANFVMKVQE